MKSPFKPTGEKIIIFIFLLLILLFMQTLTALYISPQIISFSQTLKLVFVNPLTILSFIFLYIISCYVVKEEKKHAHFSYLFYLVLLMILTVVLYFPVLYVVLYFSSSMFWSYTSIILIALILGYFNSLEVSKHTHKAKKEILAGLFIPLPAMILSIILTSLANILPSILYEVSNVLPHPLMSALLFFACFNAVFMYHFVEHKKHKHLYGWYMAVLIILVLVWLGSFQAAYYLKPAQTFEEIDLSPVRFYVEECIRKDVQNLEQCVDFSIFDMDISYGKPVVFETEGFIEVNWQITVKKGNAVTKLDRFIVEKKDIP